jgi:hypothetical protein
MTTPTKRVSLFARTIEVAPGRKSAAPANPQETKSIIAIPHITVILYNTLRVLDKADTSIFDTTSYL